MGDMGCHVCDVAFWALDLRHPTAVECQVSGLHKETGAKWAKITWEFPARGAMPPRTISSAIPRASRPAEQPLASTWLGPPMPNSILMAAAGSL